MCSWRVLDVRVWIAGIAVFVVLFIGAGALDDMQDEAEVVITGWEKIEMDDQKTMSTEQARKTNAVESIAKEMDNFAYDYDYYSYYDAVEDQGQWIEDLKRWLLGGDVEGIIEYLAGINDSLKDYP